MSKDLKNIGYALTALVPGAETVLGVKKATEAVPAAPVEETPEMPTVDSEQAAAAKKRSAAAQRTRSGRASTILTDKETLG